MTAEDVIGAAEALALTTSTALKNSSFGASYEALQLG